MGRNFNFGEHERTADLLDRRMVERFGETLPDDCAYRDRRNIKKFADVVATALSTGIYPCNDGSHPRDYCNTCEHSKPIDS